MTIPISLIVAMAERNVIGVHAHNNMPWHMPADLKYFREKTRYKPVIMGRRTYDSIGKPLIDRMNFVVSRDKNLKLPNIQVCHSLQEGIERAHLYIQQHPFVSRYNQLPQKEGGDLISDAEDEIMMIGGASLFEQALPMANRFYLTKIHANVEGDVCFPIWDDPKEQPNSLWQLISQVDHRADEKNLYDYSFCLYAKK